MSKWKILKKLNEQEYYLELLQKHFEGVTTFEKHPDAMLNLIFTDVYDKVLGKNFNKKKISKRKEKEIRKKLLEKLRNRYGRWISLSFKIITPGNIKFRTNFNRVYKIKNCGILYGSPPNILCGNVFFTSHCLERFEERAPKELYEPITENIKRRDHSEPTCADIIVSLFVLSNLEFAIKEDHCYFNIRFGVVVLQIVEEIFIAKTFLTPDMLNNNLVWYQPLMNPKERIELSSFSDLFEKDAIKIKEPLFIMEEIIRSIQTLIKTKNE